MTKIRATSFQHTNSEHAEQSDYVHCVKEEETQDSEVSLTLGPRKKKKLFGLIPMGTKGPSSAPQLSNINSVTTEKTGSTKSGKSKGWLGAPKKRTFVDLVSKEISDINKRTNGQQDLKATLQSRLSTLKKLTKEEVLETLMFLQQKFFARHIATHILLENAKALDAEGREMTGVEILQETSRLGYNVKGILEAFKRGGDHKPTTLKSLFTKEKKSDGSMLVKASGKPNDLERVEWNHVDEATKMDCVAVAYALNRARALVDVMFDNERFRGAVLAEGYDNSQLVQHWMSEDAQHLHATKKGAHWDPRLMTSAGVLPRQKVALQFMSDLALQTKAFLSEEVKLQVDELVSEIGVLRGNVRNSFDSMLDNVLFLQHCGITDARDAYGYLIESALPLGVDVVLKKPGFDYLEQELDGQWGSYKLFEKWLVDVTRWQRVDAVTSLCRTQSKENLVASVKEQRARIYQALELRTQTLIQARLSGLKATNGQRLPAVLSDILETQKPVLVHCTVKERERAMMIAEDHRSFTNRIFDSGFGHELYKNHVERHPTGCRAWLFDGSWTVRNPDDMAELIATAKLLLAKMQKNTDLLRDVRFQAEIDGVQSQAAKLERMLRVLEKDNDKVERDYADVRRNHQTKRDEVLRKLRLEEQKQLDLNTEDLATSLEQEADELGRKLLEARQETTRLRNRKVLNEKRAARAKQEAKRLKKELAAETLEQDLLTGLKKKNIFGVVVKSSAASNAVSTSHAESAPEVCAPALHSECYSQALADSAASIDGRRLSVVSSNSLSRSVLSHTLSDGVLHQRVNPTPLTAHSAIGVNEQVGRKKKKGFQWNPFGKGKKRPPSSGAMTGLHHRLSSGSSLFPSASLHTTEASVADGGTPLDYVMPEVRSLNAGRTPEFPAHIASSGRLSSADPPILNSSDATQSIRMNSCSTNDIFGTTSSRSLSRSSPRKFVSVLPSKEYGMPSPNEITETDSESSPASLPLICVASPSSPSPNQALGSSASELSTPGWDARPASSKAAPQPKLVHQHSHSKPSQLSKHCLDPPMITLTADVVLDHNLPPTDDSRRTSLLTDRRTSLLTDRSESTEGEKHKITDRSESVFTGEGEKKKGNSLSWKKMGKGLAKTSKGLQKNVSKNLGKAVKSLQKSTSSQTASAVSQASTPRRTT
ncbi:MAG: uncharacterized protein KVP18_002851 [Porospora cf. gigantea A]|nr:MAG: hypothetical protein KVP18_002851 [Porospora cf. gigantea A]